MAVTLAPLLAVLAFFAGLSPAQGAAGTDRAITEVVKLLESMLEKSKADGKEERTLWGKYKCYCDTNEEKTTSEIADLTMTIGMLEGKIEELQASTGMLSKQSAALTAGMEANAQARQEAKALRDKEEAAYLTLQADLSQAIGQMTEAIKTLADIGADQTLSVANDHKKFMAKYQPAALLRLRKSIKQALLAASAVVSVSKKQTQRVESLLQAPFTGSYTSQSSEVVGILKDMKDTFTDNLASATAAEARAAEAFRKYNDTMVKEYNTMSASLDAKQATLSANDLDLGTKTGQLSTAETSKAEAETFLSQLQEMCKAKSDEYDKRTMLRAKEEAAIAEAVSILNTDAAFATFGTVSATSFLQGGAVVHRHLPARAGPEALRQKAQALLLRASGSRKSRAISKILALLEADNPFTVVLGAIDKMLALIVEEEQADDKNLAWCNSERATTNGNIADKDASILSLDGAIQELVTTIDDPVEGLKAMIKKDEEALAANTEAQKTETAQRTEENLAYQKDIENLVEAKDLLKRAIVVLNKYYKDVLAKEAAGSASLLALRKQPTPPATWAEGAYKGQTEHGGNDAISMLESIITDTEAEETEAHKAEDQAQKDYEDSMISKKAEEAGLQGSLTENRKSLAESEKELLGKREDLKATKADKAALEKYLLDIKPGCDFIVSNIATRTSNRALETSALNEAKQLLMGTPAYMTAVAAAHNETLGDCLATCAGREGHVECKACLASVTVPGYCAGHPGTEGC